MFSAFWAGVAGVLFAHVLRYVNHGTFGLQQLAEVLAMMYFGGLNSVYGSIVGAVSINMLSQMLRPLEIWKWIFIPLLLILVMIFRPTGLIAFRDFDPVRLIQPKLARKFIADDDRGETPLPPWKGFLWADASSLDSTHSQQNRQNFRART